MTHKVILIPGDGTGPELTEATRRVLEATGVDFDWDVREAGADVMDKHGGNPLPDDVLDAIRETGIALKGPITTPIGGGFRSVNVALRKSLDLYAQVRPCKTYPGVRTRFEDVDLIIVRENTEDLYAGIEYEEGTDEARELIAWIESKGGRLAHDDAGISIKPLSVTGTRRIVQFAFDYARRNGRRKVTAVHKANIMKFSDGLYLRVAREVAEENDDVEFDDRIVDNMCMQLVQRPEEYDVLVLPNLYGDVVSDLCAGMIGGLGLAPGANFGEGIAVFEPTHGSAPKYAGQNKVNPMAQMLSGMLMLRHLEEVDAADRLEEAIAVVVLTAGLRRSPGMSRDDLVATNEKIVKEVTEQVVAASPDAVLVVVSNPLDAMCHVAKNVSGWPKERVFGMAGILDTARFSTFISWETGSSVKDVTAMVLGGHGDQMVPIVSATTVGGIPLRKLVADDAIERMVERTAKGGGEIVNLLGTSAWYAPGAAAAQMVDSILLDEKRVLPCTAYLEGEYGVTGLYMGVPVKLGAGGVEEIVRLKLSAAEKQMFRKSAAA